MNGLKGAISNSIAAGNRKVRNAPSVTVSTVKNAKDATEYAKNPTSKKFLKVDPKKFGYPEDKTTKPSGLAVGRKVKL